MPNTSTTEIALQVIQQGVRILANWVKFDLPNSCQGLSEEPQPITNAKELLGWTSDACLQPLRLLFGSVDLSDGGNSSQEQKQHYCPIYKITSSENSYPTIPYPRSHPPSEEELDNYKQDVKKDLEALTVANGLDWDNLSLLTLIIEKYGSYLSFGEKNIAFIDEKYGSCLGFGEENIAFIDIVRTTAAVASALAHNSQASELNLIAGDLSGIQDFIYTITSGGALKSLRARSFYLELVTEEVVQQLLEELQLPRTSIIYAGAGNVYILASSETGVKEVVKVVRDHFNHWLFKTFQGKVFLALDTLPIPVEALRDKRIAEFWQQASRNLAHQKQRKFDTLITTILDPKTSYSETCQVCHRDDIPTQNLRKLPVEGDILACPICKSMFCFGSKLLNVEAIIRSSEKDVTGADHTLAFELEYKQVYYHVFRNWRQILKDPNTVLLVNDWTIEHYRFHNFRKAVPLLLGDYAKANDEELEPNDATIRAGKMARLAKGIKRVGYLRMDVDRLGKIFATGLKNSQNLPRLASLSRQFSYFFKVYLNSLADRREENFLNSQLLGEGKYLSRSQRKNLVFIYAGGDDLFISGAWNEIVEFAFDVYQSFRAYTGYNPDITLSGGITLAPIKFPLYKAAEEAGKAEDAAKANGRDSLGLFGEVFKWDEWLGKADISRVTSQKEEYWNSIVEPPEKPELFGVLPFVAALEEQQIGVEYSRSFVRNLLITAQLQKQKIKEIIEKQQRLEQYNHEIEDIRYYLHLPKVAYTLARLPREVFQNDEFRQSLKNPYNAPYFRAIATWLDLLNRSSPSEEEV